MTFSSVTQLCLTLCNPMARLPCPSLSPRVCSNSCPLNQWCHPAISSFVIPFSSHPQSFPASGSFPMSWLFASGGQVLEFQPQRQSFQWIFRVYFLGDGLVWSSCSPRGLSRVFSNTTVQTHQFFSAQPSVWSNSQIHTWSLEKTNLDSIFKSREITLPTKVHLVKATVFPVVMYGCECWTIK